MKQSKKIFTRMVLNNWGGMNHEVIYFHEFVNLFSGKSGSGKSTAMDAMQVVLYGSVASDFLNKAADDTKNKRSVLSYLRGEQKDGSANREDQDFYAQIVLELEDTGAQTHSCIGVTFEVGHADQDLRKYYFFSHAGKFPEDDYLGADGLPYSTAQIRQLVQSHAGAGEKAGRMNINRIYPTKEAYISTVNEVIFGSVNASRFKTMEKSAIALRMANGTGQFIKDYMFPKSEENTISAISDQLAAYREIKERVETLENQITLLDEIQQHDRALTTARADLVRAETTLRIVDIEDKKVQLKVRHEELAEIQKAIEELCTQAKKIQFQLSGKREELSKVQAELIATDFKKKEQQLKQIEDTIRLCEREVDDWQSLTLRLQKWIDTDGITDYVSNSIYHLIEDFGKEEVSQEMIEKLRNGLKDIYDMISEELEDQKSQCRKIEQEHREKKEYLEDLKSDKKHYKSALKEVRRRLQEELSTRYQQTVHVHVLADLFDITDDEWRNAIEGRMGRSKYSLVVEPQYALAAAKIFRNMKKAEYEVVDLLDTAAIERDQPKAQEGTLYDCVETDLDYVDLCLKRYLGHIVKCDSVEELHDVKDGVTADCYSYSNYMYRHLRQKDYRYQTIGRKVSMAQIRKLEEETAELEEQLIALRQEVAALQPVNELERLQNLTFERIAQMAGAQQRLQEYQTQAEQLKHEIADMKEGTYIKQLQEQERSLKGTIRELETQSGEVQDKHNDKERKLGGKERDILDRTEELELLQEGFVPNEELQAKVLEEIENGHTYALKKESLAKKAQLEKTQETEEEARGRARTNFNKTYPSFNFGGMEKDNRVYDELLEQSRNNFEPEYKKQFDDQYQLVYKMLRENVIATIHSEIKGAKRHRREINALLAKISFSDSIYQIDILPTDDENRQFYEMLTAEELDMKVLDRDLDGQISFGEDAFYQKYETQIRRLTDKFMPPVDEDASNRDKHRKEMEKYADYRTYLKFSMYEQSEDADGNIKKNYVDDMAGRDSGGEGQNPKYVALFAGFAMLYMQQNNRESKIRLVLLDEAFSKMDKERSEVCLHYARQLGLQLVVCVPDERLQSLIQNVDCVYAFRRLKNRISMIHINKGDYLKMLEGDSEN